MLTRLVVIRHASAGLRGEWPEDDDQARPLDVRGLAEASVLITNLAAVPLDRVYASAYARCHHTVGPIAAWRRLPVEAVSWLAPDTSLAMVDNGVATLGGSVALCTHGEVLGLLRTVIEDRYAVEGELAFDNMGKGSAWLLVFDRARVTDSQPVPIYPPDIPLHRRPAG